MRARDREDVDVAAVELISPPGDRLVTLPPPGAGQAAPGMPFTHNVANGV